ncbi:MAG: patatin-like phospholipase family protein [Candidatus Doudnabacteria bacterium]
MSKKYPKIGLALSGGAALGIAHVGALQALADHNIPIHCITGTSAGAVVASCLAFGLTPEEMVKRAKNLSWYKLSNISYSRMGLITTQGIGEMMKEVLGDVNIEDAKIPLAIVATNIENGEAIIFKTGSVAEAVMASVCIPGLFVPTEYQDKKLVDGGLVKNLPLSLLDEMGAEYKIGVNLARWRTYKKPSNLLDVMISALDIMTHKQTNQDALLANMIIEPHLEQFTASDFKKAAELITEGYRATILALPALTNTISKDQKTQLNKPSLWQKFLSIFKK